jgi:hypothetical protein
MNYPGSGRPSPPPSLVKGMLMLSYYDDVTDGQAVEWPSMTCARELLCSCFSVSQDSTPQA